MTDPIRDAASKQQQIKNTCISSKVQSLGYDRLSKRTGRATIADRVVFFSKNETRIFYLLLFRSGGGGVVGGGRGRYHHLLEYRKKMI